MFVENAVCSFLAVWFGTCEPSRPPVSLPSRTYIEEKRRVQKDEGCPQGTYADGPYACRLIRHEPKPLGDCIKREVVTKTELMACPK